MKDFKIGVSDCDNCIGRDLPCANFPCNGCCGGNNYEEKGVFIGETLNGCGRFEKMLGVVTEIVELLEKKNNDYGNSATQTYEEYGDVAFFIRISDKINRLKSLTINNKTQEVKDESIEDTVKDIIGYCLLYLEWKNSEGDK